MLYQRKWVASGLSPKDEKLLTKDKCDPVTFAPRCAGINLIISPPPLQSFKKKKKKVQRPKKRQKKKRRLESEGFRWHSTANDDDDVDKVLSRCWCVCESVCRVFTLHRSLWPIDHSSSTPCGRKRDRYITTSIFGFYLVPFLFSLATLGKKRKLVLPSSTATCLPRLFFKYETLATTKNVHIHFMKSSLSKDSHLLIEKKKTEK